ncbi:PBP1A family penicillin-binding protein [Bacillus sp. FJAT-47783]|uniref:transglycosylase domain-containing protein n=1 Tax=Bacillus sp. FJAT-47783 TaxID=2922712 RepID=UPI001FADC174|nr:PBP1A family penicillin-binding protein [Bacillus sp. FJAT-47783]
MTILFILTTILAFVGYMFILFLGNYVIDEKKLVLNASSSLVDLEGNTITNVFVENRQYVEIDEIPKHVEQAFLAVEDKRFYEHNGIDIWAIGRALYKDVLAFGKVEGGSTITQQLAKNVFLTNDKTFLRKTKEAIIAINLERKYSKEKILEMYLNQVYFGHGTYGIQAASQFYFQKDVNELTLEEAALLAGVPKAPTTYSPILNPEKSIERRNVVLNLMEEQNIITPKEAVISQGKTLSLNVREKEELPWLSTYMDMVLKEAEERYHLSNEAILKGGYKITVPIDVHLQQKAYEMFKDKAFFPGTNDKVEGAFVLLNNRTGGVLSAIGGREYVRKGFNRLTTRRQPGSTFKPIAVYAPAMEERMYEPYSFLKDEEMSYGDYEPKNYDHKYSGSVTMFDALIESKNAPAVWLLDQLGVQTSKHYLKQNGIQIEDEGLAIALGGLKYGVSPLELANSYRTFAQKGQYSQPYFIEKIVDKEGNVVAEVEKEQKQVYSPQTAWNMTRMLEQVVEQGTARVGDYEGALAGKTGTTSYPGKEGAIMDAWFAGFTPEVTGAVWIGYDETNERNHLKSGSTSATKLFKAILKDTHIETETAFSVPEGLDDLDEPIRLKAVKDLTVSYHFKPLQLFTVKLTWNPQEDERVVYKIYRKREGKTKEYIGSVKGKGSFDETFVNVFSKDAYQVVPYNPQTKSEGEGTEFITPSW